VRRLGLALVALVALVAPAPAGADVPPGPWIRPGQMALSPDGLDLYATGARTLSFHRDAASGGLTLFDSFGPRGSSIAITPDGRWVFVGSDDYGAELGVIHVLARDPATGLLTHEYTFTDTPDSRIAPGAVTDLEVSPDGRFLYVTQYKEGAVLVLAIDPASGALRLEQALYGGRDGDMRLDGGAWELALAPDASSLYVASGRLIPYARDAASGHLTPLPLPVHGDHGLQANHVAIAPDGGRVYAGILNYDTYERDPATGELTWLSNADIVPDCHYCIESGQMAVSPDGASILSVHSRIDRLLQGAPTTDGVVLAHSYDDLPGASDGSGILWSPDGRFAYVAGGETWGSDPYTSGTDTSSGKIAVLRRDGDALSSVGAVLPQIDWGDPALAPGVSINGGALYTNDPSVEIRVTGPEWRPSSFRIANLPAWDGVAATRATGQLSVYPWRLDSSAGPVRSVKHVWVRFTGDGVHAGGIVSDDIILDQTPPQVVSASLKRLGSRTLVTIKARDNRSGVQRLQLTRDRRKPGPVRKFASHLLVPGAPRKLYVRVRDGAGNYSPWRRTRR
jgi:DNA-binding beta-propeller fold protein YncE